MKSLRTCMIASLYRPKTLNGVKAALDALKPADFGLGQDPPSAQFDMYEVKRGDRLRAIAQKMLGSSEKADLIYKANINKFDSPDRIYPVNFYAYRNRRSEGFDLAVAAGMVVAEHFRSRQRIPRGGFGFSVI